MGHKIAEAIIENGKINYVDRKLPRGRVKVHIIYDDVEERATEQEVSKVVAETFGIYKNMGFDAAIESKKIKSGMGTQF